MHLMCTCGHIWLGDVWQPSACFTGVCNTMETAQWPWQHLQHMIVQRLVVLWALIQQVIVWLAILAISHQNVRQSSICICCMRLQITSENTSCSCRILRSSISHSWCLLFMVGNTEHDTRCSC